MLSNKYFHKIRARAVDKWRGKIIFIADEVTNDYYTFIEHIKFYIDWRSSLPASEASAWPEITFSLPLGGCRDFYTSFKVDPLPGDPVQWVLPPGFWEPPPLTITNAPPPKQGKSVTKKKKDKPIDEPTLNINLP